MNTERLAVLFVRFSGCIFCLNAVMYLTYIPYHMANVSIAASRGNYSTSILMIRADMFHALLQAVAGIFCIVGWRQVIFVLTNGMTLIKKAE